MENFVTPRSKACARLPTVPKYTRLAETKVIARVGSCCPDGIDFAGIGVPW